MITYEVIKELAIALSKITGYRYVAFSNEHTGELDIYLSASKMRWYPSERIPPGYWFGESDCQILELKNFPNIDWSKCQFDCKEADNE